MTDDQLIARFRSGDRCACDALLNAYKPAVLRVARRFFLSGGETEDLVQEGMCGLYSAMLNFEGGDFSAYAHACIMRVLARFRICTRVHRRFQQIGDFRRGVAFIYR